MLTPLDPLTLSPSAQRVALADAPLKVQEVAARGMMPGLKPGEIIEVLVVLSKSERPTVQQAAERTLAALPEPLLMGSLGAELAAEAVDKLARVYKERPDVIERLLAMTTIAIETVWELAGASSEAITELIATNESRLLAHPSIIERLYMNTHTRMSTADRLVELAVRNGVEVTGIAAWREASTAIQSELVFEPTAEATPDDLLFQETQVLAEAIADRAGEDTHVENDEGQEVLKDVVLPLYQRIANMTVSQKIRAGMLGSKEVRMLLIRDSNKIVASAAVRSPLMTESEAALVARNRNVPDEVLRIIGSTPEWLKSYTVKRSLVENPKTPVLIATRLVGHLRESDLRQLAKSKNVTGPVQDTARRHLARRKQ
jgi:hypothetical protein